jgi:hypothetical protein
MFSFKAENDRFDLLTTVKLESRAVMRVAIALSSVLAGKTISKSVFKAIPIVGGIISGGITLFTFQPMCNKLKKRLHKSAEDASKYFRNSK